MHVQKERGEGGRGEGLWSVGKGGALMIMIGQDKVGLWTRGSGVIKHHTSRKIRLIEIVLCIPRCHRLLSPHCSSDDFNGHHWHIPCHFGSNKRCCMESNVTVSVTRDLINFGTL